MKILTMIVMMACLVIAGCSTKIERVYIKPECEAPPTPNPPSLNAKELKDRIGQSDYDILQKRETEIVDWAFEMRAMIGVLCQ